MSQWDINSWRQKTALQQPTYPDVEALKKS